MMARQNDKKRRLLPLLQAVAGAAFCVAVLEIVSRWSELGAFALAVALGVLAIVGIIVLRWE